MNLKKNSSGVDKFGKKIINGKKRIIIKVFRRNKYRFRVKLPQLPLYPLKGRPKRKNMVGKVPLGNSDFLAFGINCIQATE